MNNILQSKIFKWLLVGIGELILLAVVFRVGTLVGIRKAGFSYRWGENYYRNFGGPRNGFSGMFMDRDLINGHGITGDVLKIDGPTLVIKGSDNTEKTVLTYPGTAVRKFRLNIGLSEIRVDDAVVIIGEPLDAGQIQAKLIRVFPSPHPLATPPAATR